MAYRGHDVVTKRQSRFFIVSIAVSVLLSLVALFSYFNGASLFLANIVNIVVSPLNSACTYIADSFVSIGDYFTHIDELKEENLRLKAENDSLRREQAQIQAVKSENERLYSYLGLKRDYTSLTLVNAKVISKGSGSFMSSFTIDKGTIHGVKKDMPIIGADGIIGIVTEEGAFTSRGISLISHNASAGVYFLRTGTPGVLEGDYSLALEGKCKIAGLASDTDVKEGDYVYTTGYGEIFPKDLCVGTVSEIIRDANTHTLTAVVTPMSDLVNVDTLMVITEFDRSYLSDAEIKAEEEKAEK